MVYHHTTSNLSFIKLYHILKKMGIENCAFFLALYDESLMHVNPLDEDSLDEMTKVKIRREIIKNPWYYIRECVRIPAAGLSRFELHRGNLALIWALLMNLSIVCLLPRQFGKTTAIVALYSWVVYYGTSDSTILFFAHTNKLLEKNLKQFKDIRDNLPKYLQVHNPKSDRNNVLSLDFKGLNNTIITQTGPRSKDDALKSGRGFSTPLQWSDETFFTKNIKDVMETAFPAYKTIADNAKKSKLPHHRVFTSTAGFLDTEEGQWGFKLLSSSAMFNETLFDMDIDDVRNYIKSGSDRSFLRIEFMYYDLGKGQEYVNEMKKEMDQDAFDREVLNMWKSTSTDHPLGQETVSRLQLMIKQPISTIMVDSIYMLRLYVDPKMIDPAIPYIISLDASGNLNRDFTSLVIQDPRDFSVVGVMRTNLYSTHRFAHAIASVAMKFFPEGVFMPERNYTGSTIADIIHDIYPSIKIYKDPDTDKWGVNTDKVVRPQLFNEILKIVVTEDAEVLNDRNIIQEISTLRRTRSGRIDHDPNAHDDTLVAYLIGRWLCVYGKKIGRYFDERIIASKSGKRHDGTKQTMEMTAPKHKATLMRGLMGGTKLREEGATYESKFNSYVEKKYRDGTDVTMHEIEDDVDEDKLYDMTPKDIEKSLVGKQIKQEDKKEDYSAQVHAMIARLQLNRPFNRSGTKNPFAFTR